MLHEQYTRFRQSLQATFPEESAPDPNIFIVTWPPLNIYIYIYNTAKRAAIVEEYYIHNPNFECPDTG